MARLAAEIRREVGEIDRLVSEVSTVTVAPDIGSLRTRAGGSILHDFYSALERVFIRIARDVDGGTPEGSHWHQDLLEQMSLEIAGVRQGVLTESLVTELGEHLRFRHLFRNLYGFHLEWSRVEALLVRLPELWDLVKHELLRFVDFLDQLASGVGGA